MDYRYTEDFARRMEAAELRARGLRAQAMADSFAGVVQAVRRLLARCTRWLPEA